MRIPVHFPVALVLAVSAVPESPAQNHLTPFLHQYCAACHNAQLKTAQLDLTAPQLPDAVWSKVAARLRSGQMPPPGSPVPPPAHTATVIQSLQRFTNATPAAGPGRVTARRLNRTEYNNTVRDLLGVYARPADDFPVDDSGYGFDNIGDVLTVSPLLMEKYLAAARRLSRLAVYGEALPAKPGVLAHLMARRSYDGGGLAGSGYLPYSMRGALYGSYVFPADGVYELRFRVMNLRDEEQDGAPVRRTSLNNLPPAERAARLRAIQQGPNAADLQALHEKERTSAPPLQLRLTVDGQTVLTDVIEGVMAFGYDRGEFIARLPLKAGPHSFRASFPELAALADPRQNIKSDLRRKVFVDYLDIAGPFEPSPLRSAAYRRIFICDARRPGCARQIVAALARRAYRRPPSPGEVDGLERLVRLVQQEGDSFEEGVRVAIQALLVSPQFLFRIEREPAGRSYRISDLELASRLSYFLWASMPDEQLLRAAETGSLRRPGVLAAHVRRLLADPRSRSLVDDFAAQWLQLRDLDRKRPAPEHFPALDDELLDAMREETRLFVTALFAEDRSLLDFLDAPFTFLNGVLAQHYGMPSVRGEEFQRVTLDGAQRSGLLTQAAILTVSSYPTRTSPVLRGKWILENLLGTPPPPPPPDVPELEEARIGVSMSMRQQLELHRARPSCAVCHNQMDALGFALEHYDATGSWRTHEGKFPIDPAGTLPGGRQISGAPDLKQALRERSALFTRNVTEKLLTYALGRGLEPYDAGVVDAIARQVAAGQHRFSALVLAITQSPPFQMRSGPPESGGK